MSDATLRRGWKRVTATESEVSELEMSAQGASEQGSTFIASGAHFEGTLTLRGDFRIDSDFRGALCTDGKVVVGPSGSVTGDIHANAVEILGAVLGDVSARRELILRAGSRLHGEVTTACLEIERQAFFSGTTAMTEPQRTSRAHSYDKIADSGSAESQESAEFAQALTPSP